LLGAVKHFLADEYDRAKTLKRGGHLEFLRFDTVMGENSPSVGLSPEAGFDKDWAFALLDRSLTRLREEFDLSGRALLFETLKEFLTGDKALTYAEAASRLRTTEGAAKMAVSRMRNRLRGIVRQEIADTVADSDQFESELQSFFRALAG